MVTIIGAGTTVTSDIINGGFVSISFSLSPSIDRLFQLGTITPFTVFVTTQQSLSITSYGGASTPVTLTPSTTCADSTARMNVTITPAACVGSVTTQDLTGSNALFISGFSYTKDFVGFGQESWSLQGKPLLIGFTGNSAFIEGFADGNHLTGPDIVTNDGIVLTGSVPATTQDASGTTINVSAGQTSVGQDDTQVFGRVTQIGGAAGRQDGKRGNASATVPHTIVYF